MAKKYWNSSKKPTSNIWFIAKCKLSDGTGFAPRHAKILSSGFLFESCLINMSGHLNTKLNLKPMQPVGKDALPCIAALPEGYSLCETDSTAGVWGHPSGQPFVSMSEFAAHLQYLYSLSLNEKRMQHCECRLCAVESDLSARVGSDFRVEEVVWVKWSALLKPTACKMYFDTPSKVYNWWPAQVTAIDIPATSHKRNIERNYPTPATSPVPIEAQTTARTYTLRMLRFPALQGNQIFGNSLVSKDHIELQLSHDASSGVLFPASALYDDATTHLEKHKNEQNLPNPARRMSVSGPVTCKNSPGGPYPKARARSGSICSPMLSKKQQCLAEQLWIEQAPLFLAAIRCKSIVAQHVNGLLTREINRALGSQVQERFHSMLEKRANATLKSASNLLKANLVFFNSLVLGTEVLHVGDFVRLKRDGVFTRKQLSGWLIDSTKSLDVIVFQIDSIVQNVVTMAEAAETDILLFTLRISGHFEFVYKQPVDSALADAVTMSPSAWHAATIDARDIQGRVYLSSKWVDNCTGRLPNFKLLINKASI